MPSILVRSLRTEAAQPPQNIFGTLRETRIASAAAGDSGGVVSGVIAGTVVGATGAVSVTGATAGVGGATDTGSDCSAQPMNDAMTPAVISTGTNFFTIILQKEPTAQIWL